MSEILLWVLSFGSAVVGGLLTAAVVYARWHYGTLERLKGLNAVAKPYFIGGSDPMFYKKVVSDEDTKRVKKYGNIFGFYEGREPQIYIADPELIRLIFIKDFDHFHNKRMLDFGHPLINEMMDVLPYNKWKVVRNYLSPQLTTGKIRSMSNQMLDAISDWKLKLSAKVSSEENYKFFPKDVYTQLTIDVIARCAFGTKLNAFDDKNDVFSDYVKKLSFEELEADFSWSVVTVFPFLIKLASLTPTDAMDFFGALLRRILQQRRSGSEEKVNDFVDVMNDMIEKCSTSSEYKNLGITETTVMCQAMIFLVAGFETTSSTLTFMSYHLAKSPKVQEKLVKEVDAYLLRHGGKIEHETIGKLVYLQAVMNETLRMHPPLIRIERVCVKDWTHDETGLSVKKGMTIQVPAYAVHFDERNFPKPDEFQPERFMPENKESLNPYAFLSFGQGPHNCIGMRFAKEEVQMAMATMLKDYEFKDTYSVELKAKAGRVFLNNYEPFQLELIRRTTKLILG